MADHRRSIGATLFALPLCLAMALPAGAADIVEAARNTASEQFEIDDFAAALEASGLAEELKDSGPYTVFAPTDLALAELEPADAGPQATTAEAAEQPFESADKERLADALEAHIVEGELPFVELIKQDTLETLGGSELKVTSAKGGVLVNEVEVLRSDIAADNGVIHIIGGLLTTTGPAETGPERQQ